MIDRVPELTVSGARVKERLRDLQIEARSYAYEHGVDAPANRNWRWTASG